MDDLIRDLAVARKDVADCKAQVDAIQAEIDAQFGERLMAARGVLKYAQEQESTAYEVLKIASIQQYRNEGGAKTQGPVTVTETTKLSYDEGEAVEYCVESLRPALQLNKRLFEKLAGDLELGFVEKRAEYGVRVKKDLGEYV